MEYRWNEEKNERLRKSRGVGFDEIIEVLDNKSILDIRQHPNKQKFSKQFLMYVKFKDYVYVIPFVYENKTTIFLKTIYKSRKAKKEFNI